MICESKTPKVYKNKRLNTADFGNYSLTDYQVFLHLISNLGGVDEVGKYLQPEQLKREHVLSAKEFSELFNTDINNSYRKLAKACKKLMKASIMLEKLDVDEVWEISVCSAAKYNQSKGHITIEFSDRIMPYLAQVKERFVLYNLKEISSFRSLYTTRLYELIQEYKETGWILMSIDQLRCYFAVSNKFKFYKDLKVRTFGRACKEINDVYNLFLQFEEIKEGRKVVAIKFTFNKTKIHKAIHPKTGKTMNIYEKPTLTPRTNTNELKNVTAPETLEGQMAFDDLPKSTKNLGSVFKDLSTHLEKSKK